MKRLIFIIALFLIRPTASAEWTEWAPEGATRIEAEAAKSLYDKGVVFIDTRPGYSFEGPHILEAAKLALSMGYKKVHYMKTDMQEIKSAGYTLENSK